MRHFAFQNPFMEYSYVDMMRDPIALVKKVYEHIEMEFTPDLEQRMRTYLQNKPQYQHGKITYSMEMYGLTPEGLANDFEPFISYFASKGETMDRLL